MNLDLKILGFRSLLLFSCNGSEFEHLPFFIRFKPLFHKRKITKYVLNTILN